MRRAPIVITATVLGTAGVLLFKPLSESQVAAATGTGDPNGTTSSSAAASTSTAPSTATAPSASASSTPKASATKKAGVSGTVTGTAVTTRFGTTQVKVVLKNGRITAVDTLSINDNDPRSQQISEDAIPTLRQEVLSKQTAAVDTVSGATYTSLAYEASLQAALDKAGYRAPDGSTASTATPNEGGR